MYFTITNDAQNRPTFQAYITGLVEPVYQQNLANCDGANDFAMGLAEYLAELQLNLSEYEYTHSSTIDFAREEFGVGFDVHDAIQQAFCIAAGVEPKSKRTKLLTDMREKRDGKGYGHAYYRDAQNRIAIADESGRKPENTDDGMLYVDLRRDIVVRDDGLLLPLVTGLERDQIWTSITAREAAWLIQELDMGVTFANSDLTLTHHGSLVS